ncbi:cysteine hydrolase family protein [Agromyces sp. SYSU T00194]|uniref:cysteine hydrolase family protein n=1 Tax=Agromyces chitinivorans TaxID=3158560 RepID=UPI0033947EA1
MTDLLHRQLGALRPDAGALLVIDVQRSFGDPALLGGYGLDEAASAHVAAAVERCADLVGAARSAGVPVYWIELATPADEPWKASKWLRSGSLSEPVGDDEPCVIGTPGAEWYGVAPAEGEPRFGKRGYSGFLGTGLAERLTADGVEWVAVAGLTTECCVAATATDALQLGWPVVLAEDATAAYSLELHAAAVESLALNVAVIGDVATVADVWAGGAAVPVAPEAAAAQEASVTTAPADGVVA